MGCSELNHYPFEPVSKKYFQQVKWQQQCHNIHPKFSILLWQFSLREVAYQEKCSTGILTNSKTSRAMQSGEGGPEQGSILGVLADEKDPSIPKDLQEYLY